MPFADPYCLILGLGMAGMVATNAWHQHQLRQGRKIVIKLANGKYQLKHPVDDANNVKPEEMAQCIFRAGVISGVEHAAAGDEVKFQRIASSDNFENVVQAHWTNTKYSLPFNPNNLRLEQNK